MAAAGRTITNKSAALAKMFSKYADDCREWPNKQMTFADALPVVEGLAELANQLAYLANVTRKG